MLCLGMHVFSGKCPRHTFPGDGACFVNGVLSCELEIFKPTLAQDFSSLFICLIVFRYMSMFIKRRQLAIAISCCNDLHHHFITVISYPCKQLLHDGRSTPCSSDEKMAQNPAPISLENGITVRYHSATRNPLFQDNATSIVSSYCRSNYSQYTHTGNITVVTN